ncbi:protein GVQW3 [Trichonephila clavipes]|nr:protein GVQW3 [Trichonephila clavipes]
MCENTDIRICIKFCFKLGKTGTETYEMMKTAFGDETMSRARVFEWFWPFKEGCQSVNSDPRSGRPSTSRNEDKIAQVKAVVRSDRRLTVREIAQECHISVKPAQEAHCRLGRCRENGFIEQRWCDEERFQSFHENASAFTFQTAWECICVFRTNRTREADGFCGLPTIRDEGRGVDPPLVFKSFFRRREECPGKRDLERAEPIRDRS